MVRVAIQIKIRMIKLWTKILTGKNSKISFKLYLLYFVCIKIIYTHVNGFVYRKNITGCKFELYLVR